MSQTEHSTILRRMAGREAVATPDVPLTASRAVRLALTRAANDTIGLILSVSSLAEEMMELDPLLTAIDDQHMLLALERDGALAGLVTLDMQLRGAMLETQTLGRMSPKPAEPRKPTTTDQAMCLPVLTRFFGALPEIIRDTDFDGWIGAVDVGKRIEDSRAAGLVLAEETYRVLRLGIDLGGEDRLGEMMIALPIVQEAAPAAPRPPASKDWATAFPKAVEEAPVELDALLCRQKVPLSVLRRFAVGQVVPLTGASVHSLRLISPDGGIVARAKLGQMGGKRAARIETPPAEEMRDLASAPAAMAALTGEAPSGVADLPAPDPDFAAAEFQAEAPVAFEGMSADGPLTDDTADLGFDGMAAALEAPE